MLRWLEEGLLESTRGREDGRTRECCLRIAVVQVQLGCCCVRLLQMRGDARGTKRSLRRDVLKGLEGGHLGTLLNFSVVSLVCVVLGTLV